jgi:hypothetical protein
MNILLNLLFIIKNNGGHHGCDRMLVGFITTYAIIAYHH